jgi:hypothetical protein
VFIGKKTLTCPPSLYFTLNYKKKCYSFTIVAYPLLRSHPVHTDFHFRHSQFLHFFSFDSRKSCQYFQVFYALRLKISVFVRSSLITITHYPKIGYKTIIKMISRRLPQTTRNKTVCSSARNARARIRSLTFR